MRPGCRHTLGLVVLCSALVAAGAASDAAGSERPAATDARSLASAPPATIGVARRRLRARGGAPAATGWATRPKSSARPRASSSTATPRARTENLGVGVIGPGLGAARAGRQGPVAPSCLRLGSRRRRAVLRGLRWLGRYVAHPHNRAGVGEDTVSLFWEVGQTAGSRAVRRIAVPLARREAAAWYRHYMRRGALRDQPDLMDAASLIYDARGMGMRVRPLLRRVRRELRRRDTPDRLYEVDVRRLASASEDDLYGVLIDSYTLERLNVAFPATIRLRYGLADLLRAFRSRPLIALSQDPTDDHWHFQDHAYWATHLSYVLDDYSRLRLRRSWTGPVFAYLRRQFWPLLRWGDLELVSEFVDVFRNAGLTDRDRDVCAGTRLVLGRQRRDGSFSHWESDRRDPYSAVHPTWVAVDSLRQRRFLTDRAYARRVRAIVARLG